MKKLLFLIVAFPVIALAEGPRYQHKDNFVQQEFENTYQDIRSAARAISTGSRILNIVFSQINTSSSTTSTAFINTTLSATITPTVVTSTIVIIAGGNLYHSAPGFSGMATLARDTTNLNLGVNGTCEVFIDAAGDAMLTPCIMLDVDFPATTSATTYRVRMKTMSGTGTTGWNNGNTSYSWMALLEIGQ